MGIYSDSSSVFSEDITIYKGADFSKDFFYEDKLVEVSSVTPGSPTTITTAEPHYLTSAKYVNLRGFTGIEAINDSFVATVISPTEFSIPLDTTGLTLNVSDATAGRPVILTGWTFGGEIRTATQSVVPGGIVATILASDLSSVIIDGDSDLVVGDEISVTGAGITNAKILSIVNKKVSDQAQSVARVNAVASGAVTKVSITRNTKLVATLTCTVEDALTGKFNISLTAATTSAITDSLSRFYYDVKYKAGSLVTPLVRGIATIESLSTQLTL